MFLIFFTSGKTSNCNPLILNFVGIGAWRFAMSDLTIRHQTINQLPGLFSSFRYKI